MSRGIFNQERTGRTEIIWLEGEGYGYWEDGLFYRTIDRPCWASPTVRILEEEE